MLFIFCNPADNFDVGVDGCFAGIVFFVVGYPGHLIR